MSADCPGEKKQEKGPKVVCCIWCQVPGVGLLEAVDMTTTSLEKAGLCGGDPLAAGGNWLSGAALGSPCCDPRTSVPAGMRCLRCPGLWYLIETLFNC